jgi:hypothetical protein
MRPGRRRATLFSRTPDPTSNQSSPYGATRPARSDSAQFHQYRDHPGMSRRQRPRVASLMPSSRATVATGRPVLTTSPMASSLYSALNFRPCLPIMNILAYEVCPPSGVKATVAVTTSRPTVQPGSKASTSTNPSWASATSQNIPQEGTLTSRPLALDGPALEITTSAPPAKAI